MSRFAEALLAVHRELDEVFLLHAEALLMGELGLARDVLHVYRQLLDLHMQHEERELLPRYAELGPRPRFPLVLYTGQHEKLRAFLAKIAGELAELGGAPRDVRRAVLRVLDTETTFKHLAEHHDGAERDGLFDALASAEPDAAAPRWLLALTEEWWASHARFVKALDAARAL